MMNSRSRMASLCAASALAFMLTAAPVSAQWGGGWGPGGFGPGMMGGTWGGAMCNPRAAGAADGRIARIERLARPTDAQKQKLDELRKASARASEIVAAACPKEVPQSPVARLELMEKRLGAMLEAVKVLRPAYADFYSALSAEQQARLNAAGPGTRRWGGMQGGMRGGMRGWRGRDR